MIYQVKGISGHQWVCVGCARVCEGVRECAGMCAGVRECAHGCVRVCEGVGGSALVCVGVRWCARVCTGVCGYAWVWDVFSEFLLENRVPTSADFNTYPIRIFCIIFELTIYNLDF